MSQSPVQDNSERLFQIMSSLPRNYVTVYIIGMPTARVGVSTIYEILDEAVVTLQLMNYVTLVDDENFVAYPEDKLLYIYVYDVCNVKSFEYFKKDKYIHTQSTDTIVFVGNKIDLEYWRGVKIEEVASYIQNLNTKKKNDNYEYHPVTFLEISAYTGLHVGYIVDEILRMVLSPIYESKLEQLFLKESVSEGDYLVEYVSEETEVEPTREYATALQPSSVKMDTAVHELAPENDLIYVEYHTYTFEHKSTVILEDESICDYASTQESMASIDFDEPASDDEYERDASTRQSMTQPNASSTSQSTALYVTDASTQQSMAHIVSEPIRQKGASQDEIVLTLVDKRIDSDRHSVEKDSDDGEKTIEYIDLEDGACFDVVQSDQLSKNAASNLFTNKTLYMAFDTNLSEDLLGHRRQSPDRSFLSACFHCIYCMQIGQVCAATCRNCAANTTHRCITCCESIKQSLSKWKKNSLMDNVLVDTDNAFQSLAKCLHYLIGSDTELLRLGAVGNYAIGLWYKTLAWVVSYALIVSVSVVTILPSFFTLLIVRTSTIEDDSVDFVVRERRILQENKKESGLRWLRMVLRSLPMSLYLLVLPYLMVYNIFPSCNNDQITYWVICYLVGVIILQILGSVRVYYSWKGRDNTTNPPDMYYVEDVDEDTSSHSWWNKCLPSKKEEVESLHKADDMSGEQSPGSVKKKTAAPIPPNTFKLSSENILALKNLILEYCQMSTFALQSNPLEEDSAETGSDSPGVGFPSAAPTVEPTSDFWGTKMFDKVFVNFFPDSDLTLTFMWVCVALVCLLVIVFANQFLLELRQYGNVLQKKENSTKEANEEATKKARESFFFSFTGAIVYGHGKPNNLSKGMRLVVTLLSDTLFMVISMQLLTALACDTVPDSGNTRSTLRSKESVECWEGEHAILSTCAMMAFAFYVPLSIMITPMLLEAPRTDSKNEPKEEGVVYLKVYLMTINVVKCVMLLVTVLGPQHMSTLVLTTASSSLLLGVITVAWYSKQQDVSSSPYSLSVKPCNIAFINYWKAASYTTSVVSAVIVVIFHSLQDTSAFVSERSLTDILLTAWICIAVVYASCYYQHHKRVRRRRELVSKLITYPFQWRDEFEATKPSWWSNDKEVEKRRHIPGFTVSPWYDFRHRHDCTEMVENLPEEPLSSRLFQRFGNRA